MGRHISVWGSAKAGIKDKTNTLRKDSIFHNRCECKDTADMFISSGCTGCFSLARHPENADVKADANLWHLRKKVCVGHSAGFLALPAWPGVPREPPISWYFGGFSLLWQEPRSTAGQCMLFKGKKCRSKFTKLSSTFKLEFKKWVWPGIYGAQVFFLHPGLCLLVVNKQHSWALANIYLKA